MDSIVAFLSAALIFSIGSVLGYASAPSTIARDCERLGAFYVGDKVFECKLKEKAQ